MIRVNLIKAEKKDFGAPPDLLEAGAPEIRKPVVPWNLIIVGALIVVGTLGFLLKRSIDRERTLLRSAQAERATLQPILATLSSIEEQKAFLEKKINLINNLKSRQGEAVRLMEALSATLPEWVWLSEVKFARQSIQIKGKALTNFLVSDYMRNLEGTGLFSLISFGGSTLRPQRGTSYFEFSLSANVAAPAAPAAPAAKAKKTP